MFSSQFGLPSARLLFSIILLHLSCFHFTDGTQNACHDLLTGASRIRAMLHNEHTDQFYLLTSSGHIFIEPISNFDAASSLPCLRLTKAKYSMPTNWHINGHPETISADSANLLFWVNPDNTTETFLNNVWQDPDKICAYPGVKLNGEKAQVEKVSGKCYFQSGITSPDFWLGFKSQSYDMVEAYGINCRIYYFPDGKKDYLESSSPWEDDSECLGWVTRQEKPLCGVVHKEGNVAVVIQDTSTIVVYRKVFISRWNFVYIVKNRLPERLYIRNLPEPTRHQMNEFIKCQQSKAETNPHDVASKVEQPDVNQPKPDNPSKLKTDKPMWDTPWMRKLLLLTSGFLLLVALLFGLEVKFKLAQAFPWNRKRKAFISQAYSVAISRATAGVSRESTLQRILKQKPAKKKATTPGAVMKMLEKVKRNLFNSVKAAKEPKKKKIKKIKKKKKGR